MSCLLYLCIVPCKDHLMIGLQKHHSFDFEINNLISWEIMFEPEGVNSCKWFC